MGRGERQEGVLEYCTLYTASRCNTTTTSRGGRRGARPGCRKRSRKCSGFTRSKPPPRGGRGRRPFERVKRKTDNRQLKEESDNKAVNLKPGGVLRLPQLLLLPVAALPSKPGVCVCECVCACPPACPSCCSNSNIRSRSNSSSTSSSPRRRRTTSA